jgi:hypothetical protein
MRVESNLLQTAFSADWKTVAGSSREFAPDLDTDPLVLEPQRIRSIYLPQGPTLVVRVVVIVEWFGQRQRLIGSQEIVATGYRQTDAGPVLPEGCLTYLT